MIGDKHILNSRSDKSVGLIVLVAVILLLPVVLWGAAKWMETSHKAKSAELADQLFHDIRFFFISPNDEAIRALAKSQELLTLVSGQAGPDNPPLLVALRITRELLQASLVYIMDSNGKVISCTPYDQGKMTLTGKNYQFRPYFRSAIQGQRAIYPALGVTTNEPGIYFSEPIISRIGQAPEAVLVVKTDPKKIDAILRHQNTPAMLISPDGIIFASNRPDWLYHAALPIAVARLDDLRKSRQFADLPLTTLPFYLDDKKVLIDVFRPSGIAGWQLVLLFPQWQPGLIFFAVILGPFLFIAFWLGFGIVSIVHRKESNRKIRENNRALEVINQQLHEEIEKRLAISEAALSQQQFLNSIIEALPFPFYVIAPESFVIQLANSAALQCGQPRASTCHALTHDRATPCDTKDHPCPVKEIMNKGHAVVCEHLHLHANGEVRHVEVHAVPVFGEQQSIKQVIEFSIDITDRKQMEKSLHDKEHRLQTILDSVQAGIILIDAETKTITDCNSAALQMIGSARRGVIGQRCQRFICPFDQGQCPMDLPDHAMDHSERVLLTASGMEIPILKTVVVLHLDGRKYYLENFIDISELKHVTAELEDYQDDLETLVDERTRELDVTNIKLSRQIGEQKVVETKLQKSLAEKELLLKEVHHRVKNNLQVISSLFSLQAATIVDPVVEQIFRECQARIRAISLIHEKIYRSEDLASIDFGKYIKELALHLFSTYRTSKAQVRLNLYLEPIALGVNTAIPCGLIINELVSNALKYAFPNERQGTITISFRQPKEGMVMLLIGDDGVGLPLDVDPETTESLGLHLVNILAKDQLSGQLFLDRTVGTSWQILFGEVKVNG